MEDVYPALYLHCKRRGYDFRMVDLRQGVGNPAANRHDTAQLHVETVRRCQETQGPNFVVRAGDMSWETSCCRHTVHQDRLCTVSHTEPREAQLYSGRTFSLVI